MTQLTRIAGKLTILTVLFVSLFSGSQARAQDGKELFIQNCAACHDPKMQRDLTGPNLKGVEDRWPDKDKLHAWIHNSGAVIASGYPYAVKLFKDHNNISMPAFANLSTADIDALLAYIKTESEKPAAAAPTGAPEGAAAASSESDNSLVFGIFTLVLAVVAFILLQVNANLKKLSDEKTGVPATEPVPFWRNKVYITFVTLILFLLGGYYLVMGAIGLGRTQDYEPVQPIFYSHKVHAGINQINCLYCHGGAQAGKQATIPSVNICMNCHMAINEYKGEALHDANGNEINGTAEIQKLYKYAGFVSGQPWDPAKAKPIEWVRIHNLPDHVYFNHSQHTMVGNIQCQTCHGEITAMDEVKQFAPLSMGWCIGCHRTTKVNFPDANGKGGNQFYNMYEKYHEDLKNHVLDSVTVETIGGTECQKCHY